MRSSYPFRQHVLTKSCENLQYLLFDSLASMELGVENDKRGCAVGISEVEGAMVLLIGSTVWTCENDGYDCDRGVFGDSTGLLFPIPGPFDWLSFCSELVFTLFSGNTAGGREPSLPLAVLASTTHCRAISRRSSVTRGSCFGILVSKSRLLNSRNEWPICSMPSSISWTRFRRESMVFSFLLRYACCAVRSCFRRRFL